MDKKIMAIAVVAVVIVAAVGVYFLMGDNGGDDEVENDYMNIIGRVNTDGSGIYVNDADLADALVDIVTTEPTDGYYMGGNGTWVVFNKDAWAGKTFATPGPATIQHVQLSQIVALMDLEFKQHVVGQTASDDTVYYAPGIPTYASFVSNVNINDDIVGAFMWEPQYSVAILDGCYSVATTNDMFPGHTCCTVAAQNQYIVNHEDETVRFLAAYIESVEQMSGFIAQGEGAGYESVIDVALDRVSMPDNMSEEDKIKAIESAFELVVYTYKDVGTNNTDPLADLRADIAELAVEFKNNGQVGKSYSDLGFESPEELAQSFVKSEYIQKAETYQKQNSYETVNLTVAVIGGDIHQLAIHYGMAQGIFAEYGINITLSSQAGGPAVYTAMANGSAQFGFIGAPPMTINSMNSGNIEPA